MTQVHILPPISRANRTAIAASFEASEPEYDHDNNDVCDEISITWTRVGRSTRAQQEVLLLVHVNALRAAVATYPKMNRCSRRQRQVVRKLAFLELFIEQDPRSAWGGERLSKDWATTPESLFFVASSLLDPKEDPRALFGGLRLINT